MVYEPPSVRRLTTDTEVRPARPSEYTFSLNITESSVLSENPRNKLLEEMVVWAVLSNVNELRHCFLLSSHAHTSPHTRTPETLSES
jgi:hypothetical protein